MALDGSGQVIASLGGEMISSPAITSDGVLYAGSNAGNLVALRVDTGLAATPWPMFRGNPQHTGRVVQRAVALRSISHDAIALSLATETDRTYRLEASMDLVNWTPVRDVSGAEPSRVLSVPRSLNQKASFYRLREVETR